MSSNSKPQESVGVGAPQAALPQSADQVEDALALPFTLSYKPARREWLDIADDTGRYPGWWAMLADVERMTIHPDVDMPLGYFKSGIANCKFEVKAKDAEQADFAHKALTKLWDDELDAVQLSYDYGWCGYEPLYKRDGGLFLWDGFSELHPLDCQALTYRGRYVGMQVTSGVEGGYSTEALKLWGPGPWPSKSFWLVHNKRWDRYYGRSQLYGAWRPWRRLATRDGAEEVIDGGFYRMAYQGPTVRFPPDEMKKAGANQPGQGDFDAARNIALEMAEKMKAGISIAMPNTLMRDGKTPKWSIEWATHTLNVEPLLTYEANLQAQISRGIGVPPELIQSGDSGSGWSGRKIPLLGFYQGQVKIARNIVRQFVRQVLLPLMKWNFGPDAFCEVAVELDLPAAISGEQAQPGGQAPLPAEPGAAETKEQQGQVPGEPETVGGLADALAEAEASGELGHDEEKKYACLMLEVPEPLRGQVMTLASRIRAEDLAEEQNSTGPHVTLLYGLHSDDPAPALEAVAGMGPIPAVLGPVSVFPAETAGGNDVVKIDVISPDLHVANALLRNLPHTNHYPEYRPHITLGHVKPGRGKRYAGRHPLAGRAMLLQDALFSTSSKEKVPLSLLQPELGLAQNGKGGWRPHTVKYGPRKGLTGWRNEATGRVVLSPPAK